LFGERRINLVTHFMTQGHILRQD